MVTREAFHIDLMLVHELPEGSTVLFGCPSGLGNVTARLAKKTLTLLLLELQDYFRLFYLESLQGGKILQRRG
jgi:hypothetical protein